MTDPDTLNKTYGDGPGNEAPQQQPIIMLAVPRTWTRLVIGFCILLIIIVILVTLMAYLNYTATRDNTNRIFQQGKQLCEARQKLGLICDPTITPEPQEEKK